MLAISGSIAALVATGLALYRPSALVREDYRVYDAFVRSVRPAAAASGVAIVDIDDRSVAAVGQWPWRRDVVARLIDGVRERGATAVALDMLMAEPDRFATWPDAMLAETLQRGRVVLGYAMTFPPTQDASGACVSHPLQLVSVQRSGDRDAAAIPQPSGAVCNLPQFERAADASGFLNAVPDADGILRRVPLVMEYDGRVYPALGLAAVMTATNARPGALQMRNAAAGSLTLDDRRVPLDGRGNLLLRFRDAPRTIRHVSAVDVLHGPVDAGAFRDTLVFVGATALGVRDVVTTPLAGLVSGVDVHAAVADNLLQRNFFSRPDYAAGLEVAMVLALAVGLTLVAAWRGVAMAAVAGVVCLGVVWGATRWAIASDSVFISPVMPTLSIVLTCAGLGVVGYGGHYVRAERTAQELNQARRLVVQSLLSLTETRDADTGSHSRRTQAYARMLATELSAHPRFRSYLTRERIERLATLAPLHDIGKVGVPDRILLKPAALTSDEYEEIQKHPIHGRDAIVRAEHQVGLSGDPFLAMAKEIVFTHHERWDGSGYPQGLREESIPIPGRIVAIVDMYDALVSKRVYRDALPFDEAVTLISQRRGTHFDPAVVDAFVQLAPAFHEVLAEPTGSQSEPIVRKIAASH
jgi:CHASE2 domain-containing sensor protein